MLRTKIILKPFWSQLEISFRIHSIRLYVLKKVAKNSKNKGQGFIYYLVIPDPSPYYEPLKGFETEVKIK